MINFQDATARLWADDFDPETAEISDQAVRTSLYFHETLGTLVKNDLLDGDLVRDWLYVKGAWEKVGPVAIRTREKLGVPQMFENFEALAND
jgi:hypothetical protein